MEQQNQPLSIITFNVSGLPSPPSARLRMRELARQIEATDAEVVNLQEVHTYGLLRILKRSLPSYPHVALKHSLPGPRAGLVTFSRLPIKDVSFTSLSLHKGILRATLINAPVVIMSVHLSANTDGDWSKENRFYATHKAELDTLLKMADQISGSNIVLTGDFNLAKDCDLYESFRQQGRWFDPFQGDDSPTFHAEFLSPDRKPRRIDYIFARSAAGRYSTADSHVMFGQKVKLSNGTQTYLSNHLGLYSRLIIT